MFHERRVRRVVGPFLVLAGALTLGACSDDPVGLDDHDHAVEGIHLVVDDVVVAELDGDANAWTGTLDVSVGGETGTIVIRLMDHDGNEITPESDMYLQAAVDDEGVAVFVQDGPGAFSGVLEGVSAGDATLELSVHHGAVGSGHPVFVASPGVAVVVS